MYYCVIAIHTCSCDELLKIIAFFVENKRDNKNKLLCSFVQDGEKLIVSDGHVLGCRGVLGEKILLDSILQCNDKENTSIKIELDIVQVCLPALL